MGYETNSAYAKNSYLDLDYKLPGGGPHPGKLPDYWAVWTTQPGFIENPPYSNAGAGTKFSLAFKYTRPHPFINTNFTTNNDAQTKQCFIASFTDTASGFTMFFPDNTIKGSVLANDSDSTDRWSYLTYDAGGTNNMKGYTAGFSLAGTVTQALWSPFDSTRDWYINVDGSLLIAIWTNYILTATDAAILEAGWEP